MTVSEQQASQDAFMIIRELGALCATPGIEIETQKVANETIRKVLQGIVNNSITKLSAKTAGIVGV